MEISYFDRIRIKSSNQKEVFADIRALEGGCTNGFMVTAHEITSYPSEFARHKIEVRKLDLEIALIVYKYNDLEIPCGWENSELLYSWEQEG